MPRFKISVHIMIQLSKINTLAKNVNLNDHEQDLASTKSRGTPEYTESFEEYVPSRPISGYIPLIMVFTQNKALHQATKKRSKFTVLTFKALWNQLL